MEESFMSWRDTPLAFDIISNSLFLGVLAGIGEAAIIRFILDIFGVFEKTPVFG